MLAGRGSRPRWVQVWVIFVRCGVLWSLDKVPCPKGRRKAWRLPVDEKTLWCLPIVQQSCILASNKGEERTAHSPEPTMHTRSDHAPIKGKISSIFFLNLLFQLLFRNTLQHWMHKSKGCPLLIYFLWPEVWFQRPSTSELSGGSQPAHPQLFTNKVTRWQYQTGACPCKPDSYCLFCAWHWIFYTCVPCTCLQRNG